MANETITSSEDGTVRTARRDVATNGSWQYVTIDVDDVDGLISGVSWGLREIDGDHDQDYRVLYSTIGASDRQAPSVSENDWLSLESSGHLGPGGTSQGWEGRQCQAIALAIRQDSGPGTVEAWLQVAAEGSSAKIRGDQSTIAEESVTTTDTYQWAVAAKGGDTLSLTGHYEIQNTGGNPVETQVLYSRVPAANRDAPGPSSADWHELAPAADTGTGAQREASFDESITALAIGYAAATDGSQTTVNVYGGLQ
jgi:hypothetical protein